MKNLNFLHVSIGSLYVLNSDGFELFAVMVSRLAFAFLLLSYGERSLLGISVYRDQKRIGKRIGLTITLKVLFVDFQILDTINNAKAFYAGKIDLNGNPK